MNPTSPVPRASLVADESMALRTVSLARAAPKTARAFAAVAMPALAALLAACASPTPAPVLLSLPPAVTGAPLATATATAAGPAPGAPPLLAIRRVGIPEYLEARRVRYRADPATLAEWPNTYWAERIEVGVSREFIAALRQQLPGWTMCEATCGDRLPTLALQVDLVPMEFVRGTGPRLQARARIAVSSTGTAPALRQTLEQVYDLPASADTAQGQAEAITALLKQVAAATAPLVTASQR